MGSGAGLRDGIALLVDQRSLVRTIVSRLEWLPVVQAAEAEKKAGLAEGLARTLRVSLWGIQSTKQGPSCDFNEFW